ncbi:hypothetical protein [Natronolimnobius baerhuensis]|uniref:Uncharacterized protein n=1 Tax=Natronolimnobius baerhuensis TaxID=253108 RepID=A0A202E6V2_9EURY|nr:hypothetical protein [Natronolimnobius baerhuensis]OVE83996.1 hypothetical protein B2G88_13205 [Natronolimnobius baerhuensis]
MMWQDLVFLAGSVLSIVFLAPTIRDASARIPLGSSVPSMTIGTVYAVTYGTLGMTFSAVGSLGVAIMWSLIVSYRAPRAETGPQNVYYFLLDLREQAQRFAVRVLGDEPATPAQSGHEQSAD